MTEPVVQIALASDKNMIDPALVVIGSALERCSTPVRVHFLGFEIPAKDKDRLQSLCDLHGAELIFHDLQMGLFGAAEQQNPKITLVTLARMYLPQLTTGRVIYLDCDMLVQGNLAELFAVDLQGKLLGVVRDFLILHRLSKSEDQRQRLHRFAEIVAPEPVETYFNAGLLVMECDAIAAQPNLCAAMTDGGEASKYPMLDQDYLNVLFRGQTAFVPLRWNMIWGRAQLYQKVAAKLSYVSTAEQSNGGAVIHYTGPSKPWKKIRFGMVLKGRLPAILKYRRAARHILDQI